MAACQPPYFANVGDCIVYNKMRRLPTQRTVMDIDISALTAKELDDLILQCAERRADLLPRIPAELAGDEEKIVAAINNPRWNCSLDEDYTILSFRHPGLGWLSFAMPHPERSYLMTTFFLHSTITRGETEPNSAGNIPVFDAI